MEQKVGSITPGKLANFAILADNPLTLETTRTEDIAIWGTVHEGRIPPVETGIGDQSTAVLGPVFDASTLAARVALDRHGAAAGKHGDACGAARALSWQFGALDRTRRAVAMERFVDAYRPPNAVGLISVRPARSRKKNTDEIRVRHLGLRVAR